VEVAVTYWDAWEHCLHRFQILPCTKHEDSWCSGSFFVFEVVFFVIFFIIIFLFFFWAGVEQGELFSLQSFLEYIG